MNVMWERWEVIDYYTLGSLICPSILIVNLQGQGLASSFQRDQLYRCIIGRNNIDWDSALEKQFYSVQICTVHQTERNKRCTTIHTNWNGMPLFPRTSLCT